MPDLPIQPQPQMNPLLFVLSLPLLPLFLPLQLQMLQNQQAVNAMQAQQAQAAAAEQPAYVPIKSYVAVERRKGGSSFSGGRCPIEIKSHMDI